MYILSQLSWCPANHPNVDPLVMGYYDSAHRWNAIPLFYMDFYQVLDLIQFYEKHPQFDRILTIDRATDTLITIHEGITKIPFQKVTLGAGRLPATVWPIDFESSYFDVKVASDGRIFTSVDIQDAVVYGIAKGMDAGRNLNDLNDGHTPMDCAILYTQTLEGS